MTYPFYNIYEYNILVRGSQKPDIVFCLTKELVKALYIYCPYCPISVLLRKYEIDIIAAHG